MVNGRQLDVRTSNGLCKMVAEIVRSMCCGLKTRSQFLQKLNGSSARMTGICIFIVGICITLIYDILITIILQALAIF
jgi:hypothetical protein